MPSPDFKIVLCALKIILETVIQIISMLDGEDMNNYLAYVHATPPNDARRSTQALSRELFKETINWSDDSYKSPSSADEILKDERRLFFETYLTKKDFEELYQRLEYSLLAPLEGYHNTQLGISPRHKLLLVLMWIRRYYPEQKLALDFGISEGRVSRILKTLIPRLSDDMSPEISFPSMERIIALKGMIPEFEEAIGSVDGTIHKLRLPTHHEYRYFRSDKHTRFFNTLALVDFSGVILFAEPGFAGRMTDTDALLNSELYAEIIGAGVDVLVDGGFAGRDHCIRPDNTDAELLSIQMANRARVECTFRELHARF